VVEGERVERFGCGDDAAARKRLEGLEG
jgi:hypothetical protein